MSDTPLARTDRELQMLEAMVDCAFALGEALGEAARAESDLKRHLQLVDAFNRCFLAVRMGIRLSMTLRAPPKPARAAAVERDPDDERDETERYNEGEGVEREREYEPVSLPRFLATLGVVARETARLEGLPDDIRTRILPTLNNLLAQAKTGAASPPPSRSPAGADVLLRPPPAAPRARLLGSAALPPGAPNLPRPPPRRSG